MHYISKAENWAIDLYPKEKEKENNNYKISNYTIITPHNDGYIVFNSITWSMYFLSHEEYNNIMTNDLLIKNKVIIPDNIDENEIAHKAYLSRTAKKVTNPYEKISNFIIFTTNECNARCSYCYENIKKGNMSIETAEKVVSFIKNHLAKKCHITWFGGEPLKNIPIIDYISKRLKEENVNFYSTMISNASLFTPEVLDKAVNQWNLKQIQITFDGPEKIYNQIKNYKDLNGNPFEIVINNANFILKNSEITVNARINVGNENINYIENLIQYLQENIYNENNHFSIYCDLIQQVENDLQLLKKDNFEKKYYDLRKKYFYNSNKNYIKKDNLVRCMVDYCTGIVITPNGNLHYCEHASPENQIGNLTDGIINQENVDFIINKNDEHIDFCLKNKCKLLPVCNKTHFCNPNKRCSKIEFLNHEYELFDEKLKSTVDYYFNKLKENKNKEKGEE